MGKNRNLFSGIAARVNEATAEVSDSSEERESAAQRVAPFAANIAGITNPRAPGAAEAKIHKTLLQRNFWVDPKRCRPWAHHNRAYDLLNEQRCQDLISGFRSLGKQQRPAIVRTIQKEETGGEADDPYDYEIISGARRHWTVSWLRERGETNAQGEPFWFLVLVRDDLDSTTAFELSDAENRGQKDISDFERAREYQWALEQLYDGNMSRMAQALQMDRSNLTRLIALTDMPQPIVSAYPSILDIRTSHWRQLGPYFSSKETEKREAADRILACARAIAEARKNHSDNVPGDWAQTTAMLLSAVQKRKRGGDRTQVLRTVSAESTGRLALRVKRTTRGMTFELPRASGATKDEIHEALRNAVDEYFEM